jgi:enterochelin esterase-like enzyme
MSMRALVGLAMLAWVPVLGAQPRVDVTFQVNQTTTVGTSVFVLGDLPELGGNDVRKAVKLEPSAYPSWRATIALPAGRTFTYRYYTRLDAPSQAAVSTNGTPVSAPVAASTPDPNLARKAMLYHSGFTPSVLFWRVQGAASFTRTEMIDLGPGRNANERRWFAPDLAPGGTTIEFYVTNTAGTGRDPLVGTYATPLNAFFLQDGQLYSYVPAATVAAARKDYTVSAPLSYFSNLLNETRRFRVILPRGFDNHPTRRYPVIYFHDGQNMFANEGGAFGSWNADTTSATLVRQGRLREAILVAIDNGPNRIPDYAAPQAGGWSDGRYHRFIKDELLPHIAWRYPNRLLTGPENTAIAGSSMGAQASLYPAWTWPEVFGRVGAFSGAWTVYTSGFYDAVRAQPKRPIRVYIDSGESGTASDNYWLTYNLRDNLIARASSPYVLNRDLMHVVGLNQQHNEAAWAARLPGALEFLLPATEEASPIAPLASGAAFDLNADGKFDIEDLYRQNQQPADVNLSGSADGEDTAALERLLRRGEINDMKNGRQN